MTWNCIMHLCHILATMEFIVLKAIIFQISLIHITTHNVASRHFTGKSYQHNLCQFNLKYPNRSIKTLYVYLYMTEQTKIIHKGDYSLYALLSRMFLFSLLLLRLLQLRRWHCWLDYQSYTETNGYAVVLKTDLIILQQNNCNINQN